MKLPKPSNWCTCAGVITSPLSAGFQPTFGRFSAHFQQGFSPLSAGFQPTFSRFSAHFRQVFSPLSAGFQPTFSRFSAHFQQVFSPLSADFQPTFGRFSAHFQQVFSQLSAGFLDICSVMHQIRNRKVNEVQLLITVNRFSFKRSVFNKLNKCVFVCLMLLCYFTFLCLGCTALSSGTEWERYWEARAKMMENWLLPFSITISVTAPYY